MSGFSIDLSNSSARPSCHAMPLYDRDHGLMHHFLPPCATHLRYKHQRKPAHQGYRGKWQRHPCTPCTVRRKSWGLNKGEVQGHRRAWRGRRPRIRRARRRRRLVSASADERSVCGRGRWEEQGARREGADYQQWPRRRPTGGSKKSSDGETHFERVCVREELGERRRRRWRGDGAGEMMGAFEKKVGAR